MNPSPEWLIPPAELPEQDLVPVERCPECGADVEPYWQAEIVTEQDKRDDYVAYWQECDNCGWKVVVKA